KAVVDGVREPEMGCSCNEGEHFGFGMHFFNGCFGGDGHSSLSVLEGRHCFFSILGGGHCSFSFFGGGHCSFSILGDGSLDFSTQPHLLGAPFSFGGLLKNSFIGYSGSAVG